MSRTGQNFFQMQEDAMEMTRDEFIKKYGKINEDLYERIWNDNEPDPE